MKSQIEKADFFRSLHRRGDPFVLPNCWDVPSARIFENSGFQAIATSSAGVMVSLGFPDGEAIGLPEYLAAVGRIGKVLSLPLSVDIVGGFGSSPIDVEHSVKYVLELGAVGINIEDLDHETGALRSAKTQVERVRAAKTAGVTKGVPVVINARTDALRVGGGDGDSKFEDAVSRATAYRDAGADCVYPMGLTEASPIREFVNRLSFPVNVMVRKGLPSLPELKQLGIARVSFGPAASYAALGLLKRASKEIMERGTFETLVDGAISFDELNDLARPKPTG
ncbi:MAG TPA: isocitrate lyase/phosphoenolpyruvate mutase family protein [Nitrososphaerales archaeon]|nr:isocitrate lyase/phosphoenolpyruvate mutase family protein [Nitrososphaerales archaeon]